MTFGEVGAVVTESAVAVVDGEERIAIDAAERVGYGVGILIGLVGVC